MTIVQVDQDTGEIIDIDGDLPDDRALTVREPVGLARASDPADMIAMASKMATALRDIVERQKLYAVISGKKYPQVEAWATIARMDNVVAREAATPIRHDDGSYEAFVELIRLGDMAIIGRASAVCGAADDKPWSTRPEYARRSMAVTRATSRAFRQHYSWIMALAGYEPTPADEMPVAGSSSPARAVPAADDAAGAETYTGKAERGQPPVDGEMRTTATGDVFGFSLRLATQKRIQVIAEGPMASALAAVDDLIGADVTVTGVIEMVPWDKDGKKMPPYRRLHLERIETPDFTLPAVAAEPQASAAIPTPALDDEAELDALL